MTVPYLENCLYIETRLWMCLHSFHENLSRKVLANQNAFIKFISMVSVIPERICLCLVICVSVGLMDQLGISAKS